MNYRKYNGLSDYLLTEEGKVFTNGLNPVPFERKGKIWSVKLTTDEEFALIKGKKESVRLVRRYTKDQVIKMYEAGKDFKKPDEKVEKVIKDAGLKVNKSFETPSVIIPVVRKIAGKSHKEPSKFEKAVISALDKDEGEGKVKQFSIGKRISKDGVIYKSANLAAKSVGLSINTVMKRAKEGKDGFSYVD